MRSATPTRPVPFWRLFLRGWGLVAIIAVPVVLILSAMTLIAGHTALRLAIEGVTTEAQITAKRRQDADADSRTDSREIYSLEFTFAADGEAITDTATVSKDFSHSVRRLDVVPLRYAASNPSINEIEPGAAMSDIRAGIIGLVLVVGIGGAILRRQWRRAADKILVRDRGEPRTAIVTAHESTGYQVNDSSTYRLHWRDENGATGRTTPVNRLGLREFPVGSEITLYYDVVGGLPPVWQVEVGPPARKP